MDQQVFNDFYRAWSGIELDALSDGQLTDYENSLREEWRAVQEEKARRKSQGNF